MKSLNTIVNVLGIYVCFLLLGVLQEGIHRIKHHETGETFSFPILLVTCCSLINCSVAIYLLTLQKHQSKYMQALKSFPAYVSMLLRGKTSMIKESDDLLLIHSANLIALTYFGSAIFTNLALQLVPYPVQLIVKSAKAVPVILGGVLIFKNTYPFHDYLCATLVTLSLILYQVPRLTSNNSESTGNILGYLLLLMSLICDSMTGPRQDMIKKKMDLHFLDLMVMVNLPAVIFGIFGTCFLEKPNAVNKTLSFGAPLILKLIPYVLCGAIGQVFVIRVLNDLGSLKLTLITTTRKFIAIILSVLIYRNSISLIQWLAIGTLLSAGFSKPLCCYAQRIMVKSK